MGGQEGTHADSTHPQVARPPLVPSRERPEMPSSIHSRSINITPTAWLLPCRATEVTVIARGLWGPGEAQTAREQGLGLPCPPAPKVAKHPGTRLLPTDAGAALFTLRHFFWVNVSFQNQDVLSFFNKNMKLSPHRKY